MTSIQIYTTETVKKQLRLLAALAEKSISQYAEEVLLQHLAQKNAQRPMDTRGR